MIDHVSIQCADVAATTAFYDTVLATIGGQRILEFGDVIGYGVPPMPDFWVGPHNTGEGFRESHIAFSAPDRGAVRAFVEAARRRAPRCCTSPGSGRSTTPTTTAASSVTPTGTTSRRCATCRSDASARWWEVPPTAALRGVPTVGRLPLRRLGPAVPVQRDAGVHRCRVYSDRDTSASSRRVRGPRTSACSITSATERSTLSSCGSSTTGAALPAVGGLLKVLEDVGEGCEVARPTWRSLQLERFDGPA